MAADFWSFRAAEVIAPAVTLLFILVTIYLSVLNQKKATALADRGRALGLYSDFLKFSIDNPDLALPHRRVVFESERERGKYYEEFDLRYRWFIGLMCLSLEAIIRDAHDPEWDAVIRFHLTPHKDMLEHLKNEQVSQKQKYFCMYSDDFRRYVSDLIGELPEKSVRVSGRQGVSQ